jgi:hypothetical protein
MTKVITIDGNRYVLPTEMSNKDIQSLAGFLITLTKIDYEWMYGQEESLYFANEGAKVSIDQFTLVSKEEAKARSTKARAEYDAKKLAEERAKAGDLVGLHVNQ